MRVQQPSKRTLQINLYCFAVATNVWALLVLLYGVMVQRLSNGEKTLAAVLTAISVFAW
jgi:hypothetical protein